MKTIITTLPIYNKTAKQCYERSKHALTGMYPIVCPRHRLPSFQWIDDTDGAASVAKIETISTSGAIVDITTWFTLPAMIPLEHDYFVYSGATLLKLLATGNYYLQITMDNGFVYFSEWFKIDCVYQNLVKFFYNSGYETFTSLGTVISSAINSAGTGEARSDTDGFLLSNGENINIVFFLTLNSGQLPTVIIKDQIGNVIDSQVAVAGLNNIILTNTVSQICLLWFNNTAAGNWSITELFAFRDYSEKYLTLNFHNDCDLGDFYYHGGFNQTIWIESEAMEITFPLEEEGAKNGESKFIRSFARQDKKYILRTKEMPDYMVDVFHRLRLHDTVILIDKVGDSHILYNIEPEHEWIGVDKYYAQINLNFDFDEAVVITGCCNNL